MMGVRAMTDIRILGLSATPIPGRPVWECMRTFNRPLRVAR